MKEDMKMNKKVLFQVLKIVAFGAVPFAIDQSKKFIDLQIDEENK